MCTGGARRGGTSLRCVNVLRVEPPAVECIAPHAARDCSFECSLRLYPESRTSNLARPNDPPYPKNPLPRILGARRAYSRPLVRRWPSTSLMEKLFAKRFFRSFDMLLHSI